MLDPSEPAVACIEQRAAFAALVDRGFESRASPLGHAWASLVGSSYHCSLSREEFESEPFRLLLCVMGDEIEGQSLASECSYASDDIWHFDTECIEDHGDYQRLAARMSALARGALPLTGIEDFVDVEGGSAWLSFSLDGRRETWTAKVEDDWADPEILSRFARLLDSRPTVRRYTYIDLRGQDCLIGCATDEERTLLAKSTGLEVDWLR